MEVISSTLMQFRNVGYDSMRPSPYQQALFDDAYKAWEYWFSRVEKFKTPFMKDETSGYFPIESSGGYDMQESYYYQYGGKLPEEVAKITFGVASELLKIATGIADSIESNFGKSLFVDKRHGCLRIMRYPAFEGESDSPVMRLLAQKGRSRSPEHTDLNALTILPPPSAPGLEIKMFCGQWRLVDADQSIIIQAGRELEERTEGVISATIHRVRNPTVNEIRRARMSMAFFMS